MITGPTGPEYDDILGGFRSHREENLAGGLSKHLGGHEERYLRNRALFVTQRAAQIPVIRADHEEENRDHFVGRKVRSA
jgi:hypothetical protein